jgi:hypothetical protein
MRGGRICVAFRPSAVSCNPLRKSHPATQKNTLARNGRRSAAPPQPVSRSALFLGRARRGSSMHYSGRNMSRTGDGGFTICAEANTSGTDKIQPTPPERINAMVAIKPPRNAMFVPAARTPMKCRRLTVVTAKIPKGIADPNRKKLLTRTAVGLSARNARNSSAEAKGVA